MSTSFLLCPIAENEEFISYEALLSRLPTGIRVKQTWAETGLSEDGKNGPRLLMDGYRHVLLEDACGNTLWLYPAKEESVKKCYGPDFVGEACFEQFGMQGGIFHFGEAFRAMGYELYDEVTTLDWNDRYFSHRCRTCGLGEVSKNASEGD